MPLEWRDVPGYEGFYQATENGDIRRIAPGKSYPHVSINTPRMLSPWLNDGGYPTVDLSNEIGPAHSTKKIRHTSHSVGALPNAAASSGTSTAARRI